MRRDDEDRNTDVAAVVPLFITDEPTGGFVSAVRLICVAGNDIGRSYRLVHMPVLIGRGSTADVALRSADISRQHARITGTGTEFFIEDLGSQNGTFVNGALIEGEKAPVQFGDRVQVGGTIFIFAHHDELEDRMHQLQRLEAMGALAGGLAHDFNNALAVILGGLGLFERKLQQDSDLHEMVKEMKTAADSASSLARRLLRLGRTEPLEFEAVNIESLVTRTVAMMRRQLPGIEVLADVAPTLVVRGSQEELYQVLMNLLLNARDAMPQGGVVRVFAREVAFDRAQAATLQLPAPGDYIELAAVDTGSGMDEATLARIFEPFFTTKPPGQGTGLGLAMVHSIVRRHGGSIVAESTLDRGTTFRIWLPKMPA